MAPKCSFLTPSCICSVHMYIFWSAHTSTVTHSLYVSCLVTQEESKEHVRLLVRKRKTSVGVFIRQRTKTEHSRMSWTHLNGLWLCPLFLNINCTVQVKMCIFQMLLAVCQTTLLILCKISMRYVFWFVQENRRRALMLFSSSGPRE